tara:strand:+ start:9035 stop:9214 length:180 start_codon:yes stop_codon:yes gene_type:complete
MARHHLIDRDGRVLAEIKLAEGVSQPEIGRALVSGRPLHVVEAKPKADADAKKKGGGSK